MARVVAIGIQDFAALRQDDLFYVDKTEFLRTWWLSQDKVTVLTRPHRFGKTLMLSTIERFFSNRFTDQAVLFQGLHVWQETSIRALAGSLPVIFLSLADFKPVNEAEALLTFKAKLKSLLDRFAYLYESVQVDAHIRQSLKAFNCESDDEATATILARLCLALTQHHGTRPVLLIDEYDALYQEAWRHGYWSKIVKRIETWSRATFIENQALGRALLVGITSVEARLNLEPSTAVVNLRTPRYERAFGFTLGEVRAALVEYDLMSRFDEVQNWYEGFRFGFGQQGELYNPWSIIHFLRYRTRGLHWFQAGPVHYLDRLLSLSDASVKSNFEALIRGEQIVVSYEKASIWQLLVSIGYLKIVSKAPSGAYQLQLTNIEVQLGFENMIRCWFDTGSGALSDFVIALLACDIDALNACMTQMAEERFSFFDATGRTPENFYHGFVLGMLVQLKDRFIISSNRESGYGRYDVMLEPKNPRHDDAYILEFKVRQPGREATLEETLHNAKLQITAKAYDRELVKRGIEKRRIHALGIVFDQKKVLIG